MGDKIENTDIIENTEPLVLTRENCLTQDECEHMIRISKPAMKKSLVSSGDKGVESAGRTSHNAWIQHGHDEITKTIGEKIAKIVGMPLENAEAFQIIYYDTNAEYRSHYDSWDHNGTEKTLRCMKYGGARLKTALVYLNDVEEGGSTKLSRVNIDVLPKRGKLLLFENTYPGTNIKHPLSEHAGMPVIKGEKYAFNLWFKECHSKKLYAEFNPEYYNNRNNCNNNKEVCLENKYTMEVGDYFPFVTLQFQSGQDKHIHNYVDNKNFAIIVVKNIENIGEIKLKYQEKFHYIILYECGKPLDKITPICCNDTKIYKLFEDCKETIHAYLLCPNRKIYKKYETDTIDEFNKQILETSVYTNHNVPYLLIENVLSPELLSKIHLYYDSNNTMRQTHNTSTKNRHHIHPNKQLEIDIDNKLSRSLFPEIKKIFNFHVNYRELYKICSYDAETDGRFHAHRDTPTPFQHRRYAMSLFLNDDYEGGEFELPEYNFKIKPKANCALIFPGICSHKVNRVTNGSRRVVITFFCSEIDGKTKENPTYAVKSNFFKDHDVKYSEIYPE
jgi:prolyl 4-hydroxylase